MQLPGCRKKTVTSGRGISTQPTRYIGTWVAICVAPLVLQAVLLQDVVTSAETTFESPVALFTLVLIAASLCVVTSLLVLLRAVFSSTFELVPVGLFFMAVSALPLAHGLLTPGVIVGDNTATMGTALWAIPVGLIFALPNLLPPAQRRSLLPRYWKPWLATGLVVMLFLMVISLLEPNWFPAYRPGGDFERILAIISIVGVTMLSFRQVRLAQIARNRGPLIIAVGYAFVASSAVLWFGAEPYSAGFWAAHLLDITGVFAGTLGVLVVYRKTDDVREALTPVLLSDPMSALELGLEPIVHAYVADLEAKDTITRDHVVRTAELALLVGEELGYDGDDLRHISLVGLLHDVGKLDIPDHILNKPGKLTDEEFAIIKQHPVSGADRALASPVLSPLSPGIRGHHERVDGRGYPDQLRGDEIPMASRIVAACDAFDAMANSRQYRTGMGRDKAVSILREHEGAQWDADVVEALVAVVSRLPAASETPRLDRIGREIPGQTGVERVGCDCLPADLMVAGH